MWMVLMVVALLPLVAVVIAVLARRFRPLRFEKKEPEQDLGICIDDTEAWAPRPPIRVKDGDGAARSLLQRKLQLEQEFKAGKERDG